MRRSAPVLVSLTFALASILATAPAAQAAAVAYPSKSFRIEYGNTYTAGTVTFYNRAVRIAGEQKSVSSSGCRWTIAEAFRGSVGGLGASQSQSTCGRSEKYSFDISTNVEGGAEWVEVGLAATGSGVVATKRVDRP
jgi:hypothetical protein